jgi:hypothetical protein
MNTDIINELNELSESELSELQTRLSITPDMRIHISKNPIYKLELRSYTQIPSNKPRGLWYGFGDNWIDWVETIMPEWMGEYIYRVYIDGSNVLQIKDYSEIKEFYKEYISRDQLCPGGTYFVDWNRIATKYDGIEINPYIGEARLKYDWYHTWDVASGCIWNLDMVKYELL